MKLSIDQLNELKYSITNELVKEGVIRDCTDNDMEDELITENCILSILVNNLPLMGIDVKQ